MLALTLSELVGNCNLFVQSKYFKLGADVDRCNHFS